MKIRKKDVDKEKVDITDWNSWGCEPSTFDWSYDSDETAYVFEGKVIIKPSSEEEEVEIKGGQLVQFPKGMKCTWKVIEPIRKVYTFKKFDWDAWEKSLEE
ncbi:MAG: cupin domain-containing protein [Candidatus Heimdallarchaeota archaeon]|nr:MAG: cupin domain-containing protein [Candidatus Heimdallarchaeota archaeon]